MQEVKKLSELKEEIEVEKEVKPKEEDKIVEEVKVPEEKAEQVEEEKKEAEEVQEKVEDVPDWKSKVLTVTSGTGRIIYTWTQTEDKIMIEFFRAPKDEKKMMFKLEPKVLVTSYESVQGSDFEYSCRL